MSEESSLNRTSSTSTPSEGNSKKNSSGGAVGVGIGGTHESRACAACKYQRRKCAPDCPLAPYFPAENQQQFLNAHKLFGLRNLCKVLKLMKQPDKDIAIKTMVFQATVRAIDPVGGCFRLEQELREEIRSAERELQVVRGQLDVWRSARSLQTNNNGGGVLEQQNRNGDDTRSLDDTLKKFYNSMDVQSQYYDFHVHADAFDNIPAESEDLIKPSVDGSSCEKLIVPRVEPETRQNHVQSQTDRKKAAYHLSLKK